MTIPSVAHGENLFWERIDGARQVSGTISGRSIKFFVQPTRTDCVHACTIDDIARLLSQVAVADWEGIGAILLRQPRRKEQMLEPIWGRRAYAADLVDRQRGVRYQGPAIVLEAINPIEPIKFGRSLSPEGLAELDRLKLDGDSIRDSDKNHTITLLRLPWKAVVRHSFTGHFCTNWVTG